MPSLARDGECKDHHATEPNGGMGQFSITLLSARHGDADWTTDHSSSQHLWITSRDPQGTYSFCLWGHPREALVAIYEGQSMWPYAKWYEVHVAQSQSLTTKKESIGALGNELGVAAPPDRHTTGPTLERVVGIGKRVSRSALSDTYCTFM